ncbi:MAG: modification methylase [Acidimicrobiaceae bacterium]|nr:modification methylase [Acidimicrobiaceae bacterium]
MAATSKPEVKKPEVKRRAPTRGTRTSAFGVGRRESHDASSFYERFSRPTLSDDDDVVECPVPNTTWCQDSRKLPFLPDKCIALVVTSPPYFVGKEYEQALGQGEIPATYVDYLEMLRDVFAECVRVLEPGGRIAVNVANLGRKPYRSLSADVISLLQDDLGLLLRGEVLWVKGKGANGSCAWGSYGSAANPVLRDVTERIIIASKGRFDRAISRKERAVRGLPHEDTITPEDFRAWTLDTWHFPPESAKRVGHPAPFPIELPRRVIELNTFRGDCVLDPFSGGGQTSLACLATDRRYVGVDLDKKYVELGNRRIAEYQQDAAGEVEEAV